MNQPKCKIIVKEGLHLLTMPNGEVIPCQIFSRVVDIAGSSQYAIVKILVDLVPTIKIEKIIPREPEIDSIQ